MSNKRMEEGQIMALSYKPLLGYAITITRECRRAMASRNRLNQKVKAWEAGRPLTEAPAVPVQAPSHDDIGWIKGLPHPILRAYAVRATKRQARLQASINRLKERLEEYERSAGSASVGHDQVQAPVPAEAQREAVCG